MSEGAEDYEEAGSPQQPYWGDEWNGGGGNRF